MKIYSQQTCFIGDRKITGCFTTVISSARLVSVSKSSPPLKQMNLAATVLRAHARPPLTSQHLANTQIYYFQLFIPCVIPSEMILSTSDT